MTAQIAVAPPMRSLVREHWMLVFVPIALAVEHAGDVSAPIRFLLAALAIVPIAHLISTSTEHLSHYTGESVGGLLNATFGNLPELIIAVVALKAGLYAMVAASLVGAVLFNLLLVLGLCFLLGGMRRHDLAFNSQAVRVYSTTMFIAVVSLALPSLYERVFAPDAVTDKQEMLNVGLATMLLVLFALYLVFMLRTHPERFKSVGEAAEGEHEKPWKLATCLAVLVGASVVAAFLSEVLVGAVEGTGDALGLSPAFVGIVLLASVGGAAESASAIAMARKGRLDLALGIALGSCILISLLIAPLLVFASYVVGPQPFLLVFSQGVVGLLFVSVLIGAMVCAGEAADWYKGVQLIAVYVMVALLLYFVPI
ncbi:MAG TPA: calcium/proton exchanger [Xanthomonadales bacterium]|nr:calcium/proton exchanger [Xanthomonadales bacterium]